MKRKSPRRPRPAPLLAPLGAPAATGMSQLESLLNWRLLKGSHAFPGAAGGTCIVEAAIVVAGREYTEVDGADDFPLDFSWPLGWYLLRVQDALPDEPRQRLIPFVTRLPGSADKEDIENQRITLLLGGTSRCILPILASALPKVSGAQPPHDASRRQIIDWSARVATLAVEKRPTITDAIVDRIIDIADAAFRIGRPAQPIDPLTALVRLEAVRPQPPRRTATTIQKAC